MSAPVRHRGCKSYSKRDRGKKPPLYWVARNAKRLMNHLAHARLAGPDPLDVAANLMGDFVRGRLKDRFPPRVKAGIRLHRAVDAYTDAHPVHRQSRTRLAPPFRRYAPILVDIYYDHFLACHFQRFHDQPVEEFSSGVYDALERHRDILPVTLRRLAPIWRHRDLLAAYADVAVIDEVLVGISKRLTRDNPVHRGGGCLREHYQGFEADFLAFFPDLLGFAREKRRHLAEDL